MYNIQDIKERIDCVEVAKRCNLPIKGPGDRCVSPLRAGAKNPTSFVVYRDFWYDFGQAKGGDAIDLLAEIRFDSDKGAAIREMAHWLGLQSSDNNEGWKRYTQDLCNRIAFYQTLLTKEDYDYLHKRGLTDETISALRIGRDRDGRLVIPYLKNGYVAYYCTRAMPGCNFPESKYRKMRIDDYNEHIVWGLDSLCRRSDTLVIAEGVFDAISFWQEAYPVLSAVTGFFSRDQMDSVLQAARMFSQVFIVYDNDKVSHAGEKFCEKMARIFLKERIPFVVGHVPDAYKDVSEYYEAGGSLQALVSNAMNGLTYLCNLFDDAEHLASFLRPIAKDYGTIAVRRVINDLSGTGKYSAGEMRELQKSALTPPGELEIAEALTKKYDFLYMDSAGFYEYDGRVWTRITDTEVRSYADREYGKFSTAGRCVNVCNLLKNRVVDNSVIFDKLPVITFPNGTLELETGVFRDPRKEDYCSIAMDYDYSPDAQCPEWERFINEITHDDGKRYENLQYLPGYALMPHCKYQKIWILLGKGGNGKSIYLNVLEKLFSKRNISTVEPASLPQDFQRITIKDSLLNIGSDISTDFAKGEVREWLLKIADGATIQACYKGKDYIQFEPRCKLVFACNQVPTADVINGLERRFQFVEFPCRFVEFPDPADPYQKKRDEFIMDKLLGELPGIFNWVYHGYKLLNQMGSIVETDEQERLLSEFRSISNPVAEFCEERTFAGTITRSELYDWYQAWCAQNGHRPLSNAKFIPRFREVMERSIRLERQVRRDGKVVRVFEFKNVTPGNRDEAPFVNCL